MTGYDVTFEGLGISVYVEPIAFNLFSFDIYWYSILLTFAVFFCMGLAIRNARYSGLRQDDIMDTFIAIVVFMIIGARLFFVVFSWDYYKDNLWAIFSTRSGGLAFYGGVLGGLFGIWLVCKIKKIRFARMTDFLAVYVPLGQAIGRWGNFFNQEAFGTNTTLPWGMYSEQTNRYLTGLNLAGLDPEKPVHPTFLYEFIGNLIIFFILTRVRKAARKPFEVTVWYLLLYGLLRFFVEGIRTDALFIGNTWLRISQVLSAVMVVGSLVLLALFYRKSRMAPAIAGTGLETIDTSVAEPWESGDSGDSGDGDETADKGEEAEGHGEEPPEDDRPAGDPGSGD
ncbi:MAG: prolipoprotein diacylglyceryl transferase [Clostridia bacterium]|nr:prolipoprotein diacylglyceryl transferase [Clostridia bacterium]